MREVAELMAVVPAGLWIGGEQVPASDGATFPVHDPATGEVLVEVADATPADGARALDAAVAAQASWAATPARERAEILRRAWELVMARREDAVAKGATVATGGAAVPGPGWFYEPTVLTEVPADARILREEVFGPVAAITGFDGEAAGIAAANDTEFGLAAYIYTRDLDRALRVSEALESGMVGVNRGVISDVAAPFGGVKQSGLGREAGVEGIEEYLETKYIALP
ncbi:aldehyde dehydrogenase family protein [Nocardia sp. NPDC059239]|uniref:aldehyde dehydrogenase family protein n=1 Tax=unclassified Nocardia TaxID=2637762 RepID=UPI0036B898DC